MKIDRILSQISFTKTAFTGFYPPRVTPEPTDKIERKSIKDEFIKSMVPEDKPQSNISFDK